LHKTLKIFLERGKSFSPDPTPTLPHSLFQNYWSATVSHWMLC